MKKGLINFLLLISLFYISCQKKNEKVKSNEEVVVPVTVIKPIFGEIQLEIKLSSQIEGNPDVLVYGPIPGYYLKSLKNEGDYVEKGEVILLLERREYGLEFEPVKIEAPVSGKISYFKFDKGEFVSPQRPLARIYGDREYKVKLYLPAEYSKYITFGKSVKIYVNSEEFKGVIREISMTSDPFTGNFESRAFFKANKKILPGTPCEVEIPVLKKENVLKIPSKCVLGTAKKSVFVVENGVSKRVPVITGIESGGFVEIIDGINQNDLVVLKGAEILREGMKVKILNGDLK
ncbi:MAG: efflux RND transporter periplasmic adaptor subunit [candidate division WOR-3 bacterium]